MKDPVPGDICRHFKGGLYVVLAVAIHTEEKSRLVIYRPLAGENVWARPFESFCADIETEGIMLERFTKIK
jgi:hypothetical protein